MGHFRAARIHLDRSHRREPATALLDGKQLVSRTSRGCIPHHRERLHGAAMGRSRLSPPTATDLYSRPRVWVFDASLSMAGDCLSRGFRIGTPCHRERTCCPSDALGWGSVGPSRTTHGVGDPRVSSELALLDRCGSSCCAGVAHGNEARRLRTDFGMALGGCSAGIHRNIGGDWNRGLSIQTTHQADRFALVCVRSEAIAKAR